MTIKHKVTELLNTKSSSAAIKTILVSDATHSRDVTSQAINSVVQEFITVSGSSSDKQRLYDAVVQSSKPSIFDHLLDEKSRVSSLESADTQLKTIVGEHTYYRLNNKLHTDSKITKQQAKNTLGIVSSSVVETLQSELGATDFSADDVGALLRKTTMIENSNSSVAPESQTAVSDNTSQASSGTSSNGILFPASFVSIVGFIPLLLIGALLLGGIKYCSDSEKYKVVAQERTELRQALNIAQQDARTNTNKVASLQNEYDLAQSQIVTLEDELGSTTAALELATARLDEKPALPNNIVSLQQQLTSVSAQRDDAMESKSVMNVRLKQVSNKHDNTMREAISLRAEIEAARSIIRSNRQNMADLEQLRTDAKELAMKRNEALERNKIMDATNKALQEKLDETISNFTELESQVTMLTAQRDEFDRRLQTTLKLVDKEKNLRQTEVDRLSFEIKDLKRSLAASTPTINGLENQIALLHSEAAVLEAELQLKVADLDEKLASAESKQTNISAQNVVLKNQLTQMIESNESSESKLAQRNLEFRAQLETISDQQNRIVSLENTNTDTIAAASVMQQKIDTHEVALNKAKNQNSNRESILTAHKDALANTNAELESARAELDELRKSDYESIQVQDGYLQQIETLTAEKTKVQEEINNKDAELIELAGKYTSARQNSEEAQAKIAQLEQSLDTARTTAIRTSDEHDKTLSAIDMAESEINTLNADKTELATRIEELNQQMVKLATSIENQRSATRDLENTVVSLEKDNSALETKGARLNEIVDAMNAQLNAVGQQLLQEQQSSKTHTAKVADLHKVITDLTQKRDQAFGTIERLEQSLIVANQEISVLSNNNEALLADRKSTTVASKVPNRVPGNEVIELRDAIEKQIAGMGLTGLDVKLINNNQAVAIKMGSDRLYGLADASLTREGSRLLNDIGVILARNPGWRIDVQEQSNSSPVSAKLIQQNSSNTELSSARVSSVVTFLRLTTTIKSALLPSARFPETKSLTDNSIAKGVEHNRHVEIILKR